MGDPVISNRLCLQRYSLDRFYYQLMQGIPILVSKIEVKTPNQRAGQHRTRQMQRAGPKTT